MKKLIEWSSERSAAQMNSEQAKSVFDGLIEIERFAALLAGTPALSAETLRAGLDNIYIHARRVREEAGGTVQVGVVDGARS